MIKCYRTFRQLIDDELLNDYNVILQDCSIKKEGCTKKDYINYIDDLERHKSETGVTISYKSAVDICNRVNMIEINIHFPKETDVSERNHTMLWTVHYKD